MVPVGTSTRTAALVCIVALGFMFQADIWAQGNTGELAQTASLEREAALDRHWAEDLRQTAKQWHEEAAQMRKIGEQHNNDKDALEVAAYDERRALEIEAEAKALEKKADDKTREAQQIKPVADISGFWRDGSGRFTVHIIQSGPDVAIDLGNGVVLRGKLTGRNLAVTYKWTAEEAAKHIKSEKESGPQGAADREAALKALVGKVVTLSGAVGQNEDSIRGSYDEGFESDAETSSGGGTAVHTGQPIKAPITLLKKQGQAHCASETLAAVPSDHARTRIGVGEDVRLTFRSARTNGPAIAKWSKNGSGTLSTNSGAEVVYTAGDRAGTTVITAQGPSGESCSILFTVVEPEEVFLKMVPGSEFHVKGILSAGFLARWYVTPSDVSFSKIQIRELDALAPATGGLEPVNDLSHGPNLNFTPMNPTVEGLGTPMADGHADSVVIKLERRTFFVNNPITESGVAAFRIPYQYRVGDNGAPKTFTTVIQLVTVKDGACTISKGGVKVTKKNDEESTPSWQRLGYRDPR
jgi:hypothetical protein